MTEIKSNLLVFLAILLIQPFSVVHSEQEPKDDLTLTEIIFEEIQPGLEAFKSRLLLGEKFLRLDDGSDSGNFILFNRKTREIHSFNHQDRSHLMMKPLVSAALDFRLNFKIEKKVLLDAPKVKQVTPVQHQFIADHQLCKKSINIEGLLPEVRQVLIEYEQVIVEQNKQTFAEIPASIRTSCYVANNYLYVSEYLKAGFPLFVEDDLGRQKKLVGFQQITKNKSIMQQPENYSLYYPNSSNLKKQD